MWTALAPAGLPALLSLGGDGAALPADGGRVDRSRAPVRRRQGVHHPEVRAACAQEGCGAGGGGQCAGELCRPHQQLLLRFLEHVRWQPRDTFSQVSCQFTAFLRKLYFRVIACVWRTGRRGARPSGSH